MLTIIAEELNLRFHQVKNTIELLDAENTVPFIARYRKEATGSLDEDAIRAIEDRIRYLRNLEERKQTVLKSIEEQGKLTPELEQQIKAAMKLQEVEDLYLPYKPKKRTRATIARAKGLEPLAMLIIDQEITEGDPLEYAQQYVDEEKDVKSAEEAIAGARDIVAETVSDSADVRKVVRESAQKQGLLQSEARDPQDVSEYQMYAEYSEPVKSIPPHRIFAMNRGERENKLRVKIDVPEEEIIASMNQIFIKNENCIFTEHYKMAITDAFNRLAFPAIEREIRSALTEKADEHGIEVFAKNLRALLMSPPIRGKMILGVDPGFRTGCKVAVIDATGKYLEGITIYPHEPQKLWERAKDDVAALLGKYDIDIIAIGNGTASRETEQMVAEIINEMDSEVVYTIVNEAGASVYSASPVAKKEFPELEASMRGNISIARRLMDPLSELVKIDPKSIGVGMYQHDVNQTKLGEALDQVVESCVNQVGVNLNTASSSLLKYVAGINSRTAENIVKFRDEFGGFSNRDQLKQVKGLGEAAFVQAAGFLRIPGADMFFDSTAVHPESYQSTEKLLASLDLTIDQVRRDGTLLRKKLKNSKKSINEIAKEANTGAETLSDIIESLEKPNLDPRDEMPKPIFRNDVLKMEDLIEGMMLKGTVRNVVDFGVFIDIGVKQDGLVHRSKMAKKYVKNPLDVVSVGDVIEVKVLNVDIDRGRIGLSMILDE
ncbi:RNA-binding transcriptional accessory protein [candidate division KSB1 bacterium]|nr:RNA-binding transcriptional accessory protein [candidate division KSB1 bacterium]